MITGPSAVGACVQYGGQEDMSEAFDAELAEVFIGEIDSETAVEVFDSFFQLVSVEGGDGDGSLLKILFCLHLLFLYERD